MLRGHAAREPDITSLSKRHRFSRNERARAICMYGNCAVARFRDWWHVKGRKGGWKRDQVFGSKRRSWRATTYLQLLGTPNPPAPGDGLEFTLHMMTVWKDPP
ncbi:hypothetical protein PMIN01_13165 [Paraphaeosphaeria minitans]|uniref:Uncharacterized protein n=1 Tax=Paraphaeosphaeria minitans TaxID=565426 RepID=A0A9P6KJG9_9PLEO|nr:hypothetical protein PMIN01_13165 [Paraphaeosphaeria minitans]